MGFEFVVGAAGVMTVVVGKADGVDAGFGSLCAAVEELLLGGALGTTTTRGATKGVGDGDGVWRAADVGGVGDCCGVGKFFTGSPTCPAILGRITWTDCASAV